MKKSLFAIAAVTAFAGAAQAQSSVTVYGIVDAGYTGGNARLATATAVSKETVSRIGNSMESGSRIGFRGTEDLGGGTSAIFTFEVGIQPAGNAGSNSNGTGTPTATAATSGAASNAGSNIWTPNVRQAFVGFQQKGMGNIRVGTQNTLFWEQAGSNTTGQLAQTFGSMLAPSTDGAFFTGSISGVSNSIQSNSLGAYTSRTSNTVRVATDRMAGIVAKAAYTLSNANDNQAAVAGGGYTGGTDNQSGYQLALDYVIQKANIQASYANFKSENPYGTVAALNTTAAGWGGGTQGTNATDAQSLVTASYNFGILTAYAGWTDRKITSVVNGNNFLKRTAQEIGVRSFVTPKIEAWGSVGNGRYTSYGSSSPTANITGYQLGSNYWMSKRTNLYAIYGQNGTSSTTQGAFNVNQYSIGARHTF
jgi:predicted porin